jgi:hypothetical protein
MCHRIMLMLILISVVSVAAQDLEHFPPLTPHNIEQFALMMRFEPEDFANQGPFTALAFHPTDDLILIGVGYSNPRMIVINSQTLVIDRIIDIDPDVQTRLSAIFISDDGNWIVTHDSRKFAVWNMEDGNALFTGTVYWRGLLVLGGYFDANVIDNHLYLRVQYVDDHPPFSSMWNIETHTEIDRIEIDLCSSIDNRPVCTGVVAENHEKEAQAAFDSQLGYNAEFLDGILRTIGTYPHLDNWHLSPNRTQIIVGIDGQQLRIYAATDCIIAASRTVNLRLGAGTDFDIGDTLTPNSPLGVFDSTVVSNYQWYKVLGGLWVREDVVQTQGTC